jgi:hypothetical protein
MVETSYSLEKRSRRSVRHEVVHPTVAKKNNNKKKKKVREIETVRETDIVKERKIL